MVKVIVDEVTNRLRYTLDFIFVLRGVPYELVMNTQDDHGEHVLNYSRENQQSSLEVSSLLFEDDLRNVKLDLTAFNNEECLAIDGIPDPIATVFYILTRYEEYTGISEDEHGRFPFEESILKKFNWIEKAMCDRLSIAICGSIGVDVSPVAKVKLIPTFDIDNTFAYRLKYGMREFASKTRDVLSNNKERNKERKDVKKGGKDPYDTYELIREIVQGNRDARVFWLVGDWAKKDRNVSIKEPDHKTLINEMSKSVTIGVHPSYRSFQRKDVVEMEKLRIEKIINLEVINSRQHFLRFNLPQSYECLIESGIKHDYSMGFAESVGFRCGTSRSFKWFNLQKNSETDLSIHPFVYMDGTLNEYMNLSIEESKVKINKLYNEVLSFGGDFIFVWHNETIGEYGKWKGWSEVLKHTLKLSNE